MQLSKRQRRIEAQRQLKTIPAKFESIDISTAKNVPPGMTRAFRNNRFTVMVYDNDRSTGYQATRVMIQNHFDRPIENHWSEIYKIKNEIFGEDTCAIEYYPRSKNLINDHNIYWIWIFPEGIIPEMI